MTSLHSIPLFSSLTPDMQAFLQSVTQDRVLYTGEILFHEGEIASAFYIILSGKLRAYRGASGSMDALGEICPGEIVGEMALFSHDATRGATVEALEETHLVVFPAFVIDTLRTKHPEILTALQNIIEDRAVKNTLHTVQAL